MSYVTENKECSETTEEFLLRNCFKCEWNNLPSQKTEAGSPDKAPYDSFL